MSISSIEKAETNTAMFFRNALPAGLSESQFRAEVEQRLDAVALGPPIQEPQLRGLHRMLVSDRRPSDGPLTEIYVDPVRAHMFIKVTGSGFGGPERVGPTWYGPLPIDPGKTTAAL